MKANDEINKILIENSVHTNFRAMIDHEILYTIMIEPSTLVSDQTKVVFWSKVIDVSPSGKCIKLIDKPCNIENNEYEYYRRIEDIRIIEVLPNES